MCMSVCACVYVCLSVCVCMCVCACVLVVSSRPLLLHHSVLDGHWWKVFLSGSGLSVHHSRPHHLMQSHLHPIFSSSYNFNIIMSVSSRLGPMHTSTYFILTLQTNIHTHTHTCMYYTVFSIKSLILDFYNPLFVFYPLHRFIQHQTSL